MVVPAWMAKENPAASVLEPIRERLVKVDVQLRFLDIPVKTWRLFDSFLYESLFYEHSAYLFFSVL